MKRFHVHLAVDDLAANIAFYSKLFGQAPSKQKSDYAKWMLEDPRINFAISARGHSTGVNHFGMQAESTAELEGLRVLADAASQGNTLDQGQTACCYAQSEKHWITDPQGIAWEHYLTMSDAEVFGADQTHTDAAACCVPLAPSQTSTASCCVPNEAQTNKSACCG